MFGPRERKWCPFRLIDRYRYSAAYQCECNHVFTVDLRTGENMAWEPEDGVMRAVCPSCGRRRP